MSKYDSYLRTYSAGRLLEKHSLQEYGVWEIRGEDPNCDLGGYHSEPFLERVEGKLKDVIAYGVELPGFWQWGAGGDFRLMKTNWKKITNEDSKRLLELKKKKELLERELEQITKEIDS